MLGWAANSRTVGGSVGRANVNAATGGDKAN